MTTDPTAHPVPTPAPVAVPEGVLELARERCENYIIGDCAGNGREPESKYSADGYCWPCKLRHALSCRGEGLDPRVADEAGRAFRDAWLDLDSTAVNPWSALPIGARRAYERAAQEFLAHMLAPREDARPELVAAPLPTEELRRLAERGVGTDLNPTLGPHVDILWWLDYLQALDRRWREEVARIADSLVPEDDEDTVRVPRVALIELNAAVMDRKRDLVDAIEEFNDEVRS